MQKGKLGSIVAGILAIFLVLICLFYLSFTLVSNHYEEQADIVAVQKSGDKNKSSKEFRDARSAYIKSIAEKPVWMGYTFNEVQKLSIGLGLDLKGGMDVTLQLSMPDILKSMAGDNAAEPSFKQAIAQADSVVKITKNSDYVSVFVDEYAKINKGGDLKAVFVETLKNSKDITGDLKQEVKDRVSASANVLRNRIDQYGVVAPNIQELDKDGQILLELPGVTDTEQMLELLKASANLEFYLERPVQDYKGQLDAVNAKALQNDPKGLYGHFAKLSPAGILVGSAADTEMGRIDTLLMEAIEDHMLPDNVHFAWGVKGTAENGQKLYDLYSLKTDGGEPAMSGDIVKDASMENDDKNPRVGVYVSMTMNDEAAGKWSALTGANIGHPIAIVLDNRVYSAPNVNDQISGGRSQITGNFSIDEAKNLANVLKSGKMQGNVTVISSNQIGPSLGEKAIHDGLLSFVWALVLLMIFMCAFYGLIPGIIANLGLVFNIFFTFGILASFQAVLTLSGIAGVVLALGMAVDANVLIFERAKEELRAGKPIRTAIADGYSNAFSAIFDSNLTSIITGVILLLFGTGPIKGFATTLIIGIICSFFTAVFLTRLVFIAFGKTKPFQKITFTTPLSRHMFSDTKINFLGKRKVAGIVTLALILVFVASLFTKSLYSGIDFSGGRNYVVQFDKGQDAAKVANDLTPLFDGNKPTVINIDGADKIRISTNYLIDDETQDVDSIITHRLYSAFKGQFIENGDTIAFKDFSASNEKVGIISAQKVGPTVADDMRTDAYIAVALSLLAMFLYILVRFHNVAFSLGALAAVGFTAFSIIGFYSLFWGVFPFAMEIDQTFIAAILTVIGYQINDTVVVFDRVRENVALYPKQDFATTINSSLNSTLGRTVMTSASTLLVLLCIFILGGDAIRSFTFAMIFGVVIGTLATIFIATPVAYLTDSRRKAKALKKAK